MRFSREQHGADTKLEHLGVALMGRKWFSAGSMAAVATSSRVQPAALRDRPTTEIQPLPPPVMSDSQFSR